MTTSVSPQQMTVMRMFKKKIYSRLSTLIQNCPRQNITVMMGDFSAEVGSDSRGYEEIMGQHGLGEMEDNGERFTDLCALSNLEGVSSNTKGYTRQHGYPLTCQQRTRQTVYA